MTHITIKNIGPIKDVSIDLSKVNVFMGPQSSGKSTIAKIISYCSWYEKNAILHTSNRPNFFEELITFHNLEDTYFSENSEIIYQSDICRFRFKWNDITQNRVDLHLKEGKVFRNHKISYIPAERNFVTLPGLGKYNETRDNILSFLYDWFLAKKDIPQSNSYLLPLSGLEGVSFYYDKDKDLDNVVLDSDKEIKLNHASSGLRSSIPLLIVFNYIVKSIYNIKRAKTPFEIIDFEDKLQFIKTESSDTSEEVKSRMSRLKASIDEMTASLPSAKNPTELNKTLEEIQEQLANILGFYSDYHYSQVIIEEPELNLFPKTQQELVYYILSILNQEDRNHQLILTTHSPYILFSLNNCMMGGLVRGNMPIREAEKLPSYPAWINPSEVSVYEIHDGHVRCIQDKDGIIEDNYLNQSYKENTDEYLTMLSYFEDEE